MSIEGDKIEALTKEVSQLRAELALMPDRIVDRLKEELGGVILPKIKKEIKLSEELLAEDPFLSLQDAGSLFSRNPETLRHVVKKLNLPHKQDGRRILVQPSIIQNYLAHTKPGQGGGRPRKNQS